MHRFSLPYIPTDLHIIPFSSSDTRPMLANNCFLVDLEQLDLEVEGTVSVRVRFTI